MHLLDTDTLTHLHAGHPRVTEKLREVDDVDIATTLVTKVEILRARFEFLLKANDGEQLLKAQFWLQRSESLLDEMIVVGIDEQVASHFDRLRRNKRLKPVGRADILIASIALARNAILVTRNTRHFKQVPNLQLENWVD